MTLDGLLAAAPARDDLVVDSRGRYSSAEVEGLTAVVAAGLAARGAAPGDRVAVPLPGGAWRVMAPQRRSESACANGRRERGRGPSGP
ncbi:MAG: hypothetical protein OXC00_06790 [Acidimicrobiaceae bacterium]|nr:hypothetical protein [Acidimicrobiaceae bacterium]